MKHNDERIHQYTSADYLKSAAYNNSDKLAARIRLHRDFSIQKQDMWEQFFDQVLSVTAENAAILECGCGRGDLWHKNRDRIPAGWAVTLTDFSKGMLADTRQHLEDVNHPFTFQQVDIQDIPFEDNSFDTIFANFMLYHVPDRDKALAEVRRVLKPEGTFFAITNGNSHLSGLFEIRAKLINETLEDFASIFHATFSLENGAEQLARQFSSVELVHYDSNLWVTELHPLIDYVVSSIEDPQAVLEQPENIQYLDEIGERIKTEGGIQFKKDHGVFITSGYAD